jgi:murein DD-endopeptidase MepM/ murein hydrolase activator NlpD
MTKTNLILPFHGKLMVSNGGRSPETNNHNRPADKGPQNQIYAYDFRMENTGAEKQLEDYGVYGAEVIAPGAGVVAQVVNGSFDCELGEADRSVGVGNMVMIDHQNGEFSLLCHFKYDSIVVVVGEAVAQGQKLGLCGNSGNTSQPHIHFNLQDNLRGYKANAIPAIFSKIVVNGVTKTDYEPVRFEQVANT